MNAIRVRTHLDSETIHLPQLKPLVGKDVEIIVVEENNGQQMGPEPFDFDKWFGRGWPGDKDDGFEDTVRQWRRDDKPRELPE